MNKDFNTPDESSALRSPTGNAYQSELRKLSEDELSHTLEAHQRWIASKGDEGSIADLRFTDLEEADLSNINLKRSNLQGAILKGANLSCSKFKDADLRYANLSRANLKEAILAGASLKEANILDAEFLGMEFAGSDITGAKLSKDNRIFEPLKAVEEISKNARNIFFVLLLACVYSWLTIATTVDVRLITNSASSPLPIIGTEIPIVSFYFATPLVLIGVYVYFHFYLHHLWKALATLPAKFPDGRTLDEQAYPWLVNAIVRRHYKLLKQDRPLMARLEEFGTVLLAWWVIPLTLVGFWMRYLPRHQWGGTGLHIGFIITSVLLAIFFYRSAANSIKRNKPKQFSWEKAKSNRNLLYFFGICLISAIFLLISYGSINGIRSKHLNFPDVKTMVPWIFHKLGYEVFADLKEIDISSKPADFWRIKDEQDRIDSVKGAFLKQKDLRYADMFRAFLVKAIVRNADLEGARLRKVNLQDADIRGANLKYSDLRGANLKGADLREASLIKSDLVGAQLQNANLGLVHLRGADLHEVDLSNADLRCAHLGGAKNLTLKELGTVKTLYHAKLDTGLRDQIEKNFPHLLEKPESQWVELNMGRKCQ